MAPWSRPHSSVKARSTGSRESEDERNPTHPCGGLVPVSCRMPGCPDVLATLPLLDSGRPLVGKNPVKTGCHVDLLPQIPASIPLNSLEFRPHTADLRPVCDLWDCVNNLNIHAQKPKPVPLTAKEALKMYRDRLSEFEQTEIQNYPEIWFLGLNARKISAVKGAPQNHGFDDGSGTYIKVMHDHIQYRYEVIEVIGKGSFGQVLKCLDHKSKEMVALKILRNQKRFHHQAQLEVKILNMLRKRDRNNSSNIIQMKEHFVFRDHLCITFELQGSNLFEVIKKNRYQGFSLSTVRRFTQSILKSLQILHQEGIIHCDLKPENIVVSQNGSYSIKVIDFGSSCFEHQRLYSYIQSRFYRSPEVILGCSYGLEIDMWSLGCIAAELYSGLPLFPGENEKEQIACIMEVLGLPPDDMLKQALRKKKFFDSKGHPRHYANSKGQARLPGTRDLSGVLISSDPLFLDFLKGCLTWDPRKRLTPDEALLHDWILEGHNRSHVSLPQSLSRPSRRTVDFYSPTRSGATPWRTLDKRAKPSSGRAVVKVASRHPASSGRGSTKQVGEKYAPYGLSKPMAPATRTPKPSLETFSMQGVFVSSKSMIAGSPR
ncbi:dual specificity tyrosine-phosphorylation-regulated kinase 4-like [Engraulis encrasicolus]|uniref:dual specificity tyrosine-phosphorylation-regulated kinase 4-like n=1 Tax=Engraulis encrasicolus TaxID=184585 RepID=UPI002FD5602A